MRRRMRRMSCPRPGGDVEIDHLSGRTLAVMVVPYPQEYADHASESAITPPPKRYMTIFYTTVGGGGGGAPPPARPRRFPGFETDITD